MEIEIVKWFQSFGNGFLDTLNSLITKFGEDIFFISIFLLLFWCVSYDKAYRFLIFYLISVSINYLLKVCVKRPRPWQANETILNKSPETGYSFPSGHSQSVAAICTFLTYNVFESKNLKKSYKIIFLTFAIILSLGVAISRIYLGQHYLLDVACGLIFGILIMLALCFVYSKFKNKFNKINKNWVLITISIVLLTLLTVVSFSNLGVSPELTTKIFKYAGMGIGGTIGFILTTKLIPENKTSLLTKLIKLCVGYFVVFGFYMLLSLMPNYNYVVFIIMLFDSFIATFIYPYVFEILKVKLNEKRR